MFSKDFKQLSLNQLRGKWWGVIGAFLVVGLLIFAVSFAVQMPTFFPLVLGSIYGDSSVILGLVSVIISIVLLLVMLFFMGCISYGIHKYLIQFVRTGTSDIRYMFSGFSYGPNTMKRSFVLTILIMVFTTLWSLLFIFPGLIASYRYLISYYILADDDNISAKDALDLSKKMMYGHKWRAFCLSLSFLGWLLLSALTFGIGYIFLVPYMNTAYTNLYEYLRGVYDNSKESIA